MHVSITGPPSAPMLAVVPGDSLQSFSFSITPPTPSECVVNYTITATSSDGSSRDIFVPVGVDGSAPIDVMEPGFDVCGESYNFTVVPFTSQGAGPTSSGVTSGILIKIACGHRNHYSLSLIHI